MMTLLILFQSQEIQMKLSPSTVPVVMDPSNHSFHYYIDEDVVEGSVIADLSVDFTRVYHVNEEDHQQLTFLMFDQSTNVPTSPVSTTSTKNISNS